MTVDEAAKELGCSPGLVYKLCDRGKLGFHRFGFGRGTIRISSDQLDEYRRSCEVGVLPDGTPAADDRPKRGKIRAIRDRLGEIERKKRSRR